MVSPLLQESRQGQVMNWTCGRCHQPILPGQDYDVHDKPSASDGGATIHIHKVCPPKQARR